MRKLFGWVAGLVLLFLLCSGIFVDIIEFFTWLLMLQYTSPDTSIAGDIVVRILTFSVSYALVGLIFDSIGLFNSKIMSILYFIISTLVGFVLAYIVMLIETYLLEIGIVLGIILVVSITILIILNINKYQKDNIKDASN